MIFDLQGKRRRMVQATYLILAILMGGGLVLFGVGSGSGIGGLFDAITGNGSSSGGGGNSAVTSRIKRDNKALQLNPKNGAVLSDLVRSYYQLATDHADPNTGQFDDVGKADLRNASSAWQRYTNAVPNPDPDLAGLMLQAYSQTALNQPANAAAAAEIVATARPSAQAYINLTSAAAQAGQTRKAELAGQKAVALAPKNQKKLVQQEVNSLKVQGGFANQAKTQTQTSGG